MKQYCEYCHSAEYEENDEMGDLVYGFFCEILTVDPKFLSYFRMLIKVFEYEIPKNIRLGPSHVAPQPP